MPSGTSFKRVTDFGLEIAVRRAARHGPDRTHAAIGLERAALVQIDLARAFIGACEQRADHTGGGAGGDRLGQIARILDAAIRDHRDIVLLGLVDRSHDGAQLRHADARDNAGGADRSRSDPDLDRIGTSINQRLGAFCRGHIAGHDAHRIGQLLGAGHGIKHPLGMAMRGVDHQQIDPCCDQPLGALETILAHGRGRGRAQAALRIFGGVRIELRLFDVLDRDQADTAAFAIDDQKLFDAVASATSRLASD
jgi:hypothetical protein